jgi:hypothetical protein
LIGESTAIEFRYDPALLGIIINEWWHFPGAISFGFGR